MLPPSLAGASSLAEPVAPVLLELAWPWGTWASVLAPLLSEPVELLVLVLLVLVLLEQVQAF